MHPTGRVRAAALAGMLFLPAATSAADTSPSDRFGTRPEVESRFSLTLGAEYTQADYGTDATTDVLYVPLTGRWDIGANAFSLTVPYINVTAPSTTEAVVGTDPMGRPIRRGAAARGQVTESGLGDVLASYRRLLLERGDTSLEGVARVKFGTADETRGLGTGENDYAAQLNAYQEAGAWTLLGTIGYKVLGDPPGTEFDNVFFGALGASINSGDANSFGAIYDYRQAATPASDPQRQVTVYVTGGGFEVYVLRGFSGTSPDWGVGVFATMEF